MARIRVRYPIPKNEDDFELLCLKLLRKRWKRPQLEQYGKRGERQNGIDLLDLGGLDPLYAAQCKLREVHKSLSPTEIEDEVRKAEGFRLKLGVYAILTTAKVSTQTDKSILKINRRHAHAGLFTVELLNWKRIEDLLDEYTDVWDELFGGLDSGQVARLDGRLSDIQLSIKAVSDERTLDSRDAQLDEAKEALERHEPQLARLLCSAAAPRFEMRRNRCLWDSTSQCFFLKGTYVKPQVVFSKPEFINQMTKRH